MHVLLPKSSVNKQYRGRHLFISLHFLLINIFVVEILFFVAKTVFSRELCAEQRQGAQGHSSWESTASRSSLKDRERKDFEKT